MSDSTIMTSASDLGLLVRASGVIDETLNLSHLQDKWYGCVVFDMSQVTRITSAGVREWGRALDLLQADYYCFIRCSPAVVSQFNLIVNFGGRGELVSFYAPHRCHECDREFLHLIDLRLDHAFVHRLGLPEATCDQCGLLAEFDDLREVYLDYASTAPPPRPPPSATALIDGLPLGKGKFRAEKIVRGQVTIMRISGAIDRGTYFRRLADGLQGDVLLTLAGVTELSEDSRAGFAQLMCSPGARVLLAHVPPLLLEPLGRIFEENPGCGAHVISLRFGYTCHKCKKGGRIDATHDDLDRIIVERSLPCPQCGHNLNLELPDRALEIRTAPVDDSVAPYVVADADPAATPGGEQQMLGKYKLERRIGRGGMGEVFLARQIGPAAFEKLVVLKRIRPDKLESGRIVEGFFDEARIAAQLSHRNIVQIFDFGRLRDEYYIVMEHVIGIDLAESLRVSKAVGLAWPVPVCLRIVIELCEALHAAHSNRAKDGSPAPIIHRDVSPSNVLLAAQGTVKLTDFGVAKAVGGSSKTTEPGVFKGKHAYAPPEQVFGIAQPDARVDIYAAGVVLHEVLTLKGFTPVQRLYNSTTPPPSLGELRPDIPPGLEQAFERAVALDPAERYSTAQQFRDDLAAIVRQSPYLASEDLSAWIAQLMETRARLALDTERIERTITSQPLMDRDDEAPSRPLKRNGD